MPSGGPRPGAGRPQGALTRRTNEIALREGLLKGTSPIEIIMENARFLHEISKTQRPVLKDLVAQQAADARKGIFDSQLFKNIQLLLEPMRCATAFAAVAAPYVHSRLAPREFHLPRGEGMQLSPDFEHPHDQGENAAQEDEEDAEVQ